MGDTATSRPSLLLRVNWFIDAYANSISLCPAQLLDVHRTASNFVAPHNCDVSKFPSLAVFATYTDSMRTPSRPQSCESLDRGGIMTLDEPTTNLDAENSEVLAPFCCTHANPVVATL